LVLQQRGRKIEKGERPGPFFESIQRVHMAFGLASGHGALPPLSLSTLA